MILKKEIAEIFEQEQLHQFATASCDGIPNICTIGAKYIREDGKIVIIDNYFNKTLSNLKENAEVFNPYSSGKRILPNKRNCGLCFGRKGVRRGL